MGALYDSASLPEPVWHKDKDKSHIEGCKYMQCKDAVSWENKMEDMGYEMSCC